MVTTDALDASEHVSSTLQKLTLLPLIALFIGLMIGGGAFTGGEYVIAAAIVLQALLVACLMWTGKISPI